MKINIFFKTFVIALAVIVGVAITSASYAQILGSASLNVERRGHTATQIQGGKIVVVGGENTSGVVSQAEVYDSASQTFLVIGTSTARTDHTATLLPDGRVLIAGGRDSVSPLDSTEIFNPADNSFSAGPALKRARAGHTATSLADGRILMVGGDADGSAEILDVDHQLATLAGSMAEPRALHGAALLKDGRVLIAGGVDPADSSQVLDSAEIFDPQSGSFVSASTTMVLARALPTIRVLSDGKVQVIGGDAEWSMEMFDPSKNAFLARIHLPPTADLLSATLSTQSRAALISTSIVNNPAVQSALSDPEIAELLERADHTVTELSNSDQALVAGGVNSNNEVLSSSILVQGSAAAVTTDKFDYFPGDPVTITGSGFAPGDQVSILLREEPETHPDTTLSVIADANGNFTNSDFAPAPSDIGRSFSLTATGQSGRAAQTAFSDANPADNPSQCANGPAATPVSCAGGNWVGGNVGSSKSHWVEGQFLSYRIVLTNIPGGSSGSVDFEYDTTKGGKHALDYLGNFDQTETTGASTATNANHNDPCSDVIASCSPTAPNGSATIGAAQFTGLPAGCQSAGAFVGTQTPGAVKGWNATGLSFSYPIAQNQGSSGNCSTTVRVSWSGTTGIANGSTGTLVFAFSGHIATQADWGTGNSAVNINGSPYHISQVGLIVNGNSQTIGGQDLSLAASAVKSQPSIVTTPNPASASVGATLNDSASLTLGNAPTGSITFRLFSPSDATCAGTPAFTNTVTVNGNGTYNTSAGFAANVTGTWNWTASYSGDSQNNTAISGCGLEPVTVNKVNPGSFTTDIHDASHTIVTSVGAGSTVHDKATLTANGSLPVPTGTVTFSWFTNGTCTGTASATSGTFTLTSGTVDATSFTQTPNAAGSFGFQATYSGDSIYNGGTATCEPLTVNAATPTVATDIHDASHAVVTSVAAGTTVHDKATVTGSVGTPTGTVTFAWFTNGTCTGTPSATSGTFSLTSGTVDGTTFTQTPSASGSFAFQATYSGDSTYTSKVGPCEPLTVNKVDPTVATNIHDGSHTVVTSVAVGTIVHDSATVSATGGNPTPTGTVTFAWFTNGTCTGTPSATSGTFSLTSGTVDGTTFTQTPNASGSFAFQATYNGDNTYNSKVGPCEPLTVNKVDATVATDIHDASHAVVTSVAAGTIVHDKATVSGNNGTPTGTVSFAWFTNGTCTGTASATSGTFSLTSGTADGTTFTQTPSTSGSFAFQSTYNGDNVYNSKVGPCEPLTVTKIDATVATDIHDASHAVVTSVAAGTIVHDKATVTGSVGTPSGTVTFAWFSNGACSGTPDATSGTFSLTSGTADGTTFTQTPNVSGSFAFQSTYNGDNTYNSKVGPCEPLTVNKVNATVATTIHDANHGTVTSVAVGTIVHDSASVSGSVGTPTGTVTFSWFSNGTCSGTPDATSGTFSLTSGTVDGTTFTQTPNTSGSFAFQATYNGDNTYNSKVGPCEPLTVTKVDATVATTIHDANHGTVTSVAAGTIVHDSASVTGNNGTPTGTVSFAWFTNGTCTGTPSATSGTFSLTSGTADGTTFTQTPNASGSFAFQSTYNGDNVYNSKVGPCEPLTVTKIDATVATDIHDPNHNVVTSVAAGTIVHDKATVTGSVGTPSGTVTFAWFSNGACSGTPDATSGTFSLTSGTADGTTFTQTPNTSGSFAFQATYNGDNTYNSKVGPCEPLTATKIDATVATDIHDANHSVVTSIGVGGTVHDKATVTGSVGTPSGTVTFAWFTNGTCTGTPSATSGTFSLTSGTADGTTFTQTPSVSGSFAFQSTYSGDNTYNSKVGPCEPLTVNKVNPGSFTTDIHDASHTIVTAVNVGSTVHDKATLTANGSLPVPTGDVTFSWFKNGNCSGSAFATSGNFSLTGGTTDGTSFAQTPNVSGSFAFQASYSGDSVYNSATAACEPLTVNKVDASVSTDIHNSSHTIVVSVTQNTTVHDSATVTGTQGTPTGDVTFAYFKNGTCSGSPFAFSGNFSLTGGTTDGTSFTQTPTAIGQVSFQATYLGDSVYNSKVGACELLQVVSAATPVTISTTLSGGGQTGTLIAVAQNTPVTDQAFLSGAQAATAGGTVTYNVYSDSICTSLVASSGPKAVTNGVAALSDPISINQIGTFYWQADYSGDANNNPALSNCTDEQTTFYRILVKLTPTRDSFLKEEDPNTNEGANRRLRLAATNGGGLSLFGSAPKKKKTKGATISALTLGVDRPVAAFNVSGLNVTNLVKAQLVFNIATNNGGWGGGQEVEVRRVLSNWSEGSGKNPDLSTGLTARGSGSGVTWNCPIDTNINNTTPTCAAQWGGADLNNAMAPHNPNVPNVVHTDSSTGDMVWDVTDDVLKVANDPTAIINGWIVKKVDENQTGGEVLYYSKEGAAAANALNVAPRLILYYR